MAKVTIIIEDKPGDGEEFDFNFYADPPMPKRADMTHAQVLGALLVEHALSIANVQDMAVERTPKEEEKH